MRRYALPGLVFLFPLIYYFRYVFPNSGLLILQNDFGYLYFVYKAHLLDLWAHGHFPYWSPAEAGGYGFFGNPFTAVLYPPNLLLLVVRLVTGRYSTWFHQIFTILGVSWFALGLFFWLRRVFGRPNAAAFAAMAISTCWMVSEFLRFPNAVHALAWLPWVLCSLHALHHEQKLKHFHYGVLALVCQATAGYPYFVVYSYGFYALYIAYLNWVEPGPLLKARLAKEVLFVAVPMMLTLPYTSAVSRLMAVTTDRNGGDFNYAIEYTYGPLDFVGSLLFPPVVTVEGCFYMGSLAVFLLALFFWRGTQARDKVLVLLGIMGFASLMFNFRSFLFSPIWSFTPVINQMRVFGRMATMLLPLLAIGIHQGFDLLAEQLARPPQERDLPLRPVWGIFGVILLIQGYLYVMREPLNAEYARLTVPTLPAGSREIDFLMYTLITGAVVLCALLVDWGKLRGGPGLALVALLWVMTQDTGTQGRYLWAQPVRQSYAALGAPSSGSVFYKVWAAGKVEGDFYRLIRDYFELDRTINSGELTWQGLTRGLMPNWNYQSYTDFLRKHAGDASTMNHLLGKQKLFFHTKLTSDPKAFLADARGAADAAEKPQVTYFDGSELELAIQVNHPGYLAWIDNWDAGWSARVDGAPVKVEQLLGTFKSVKLDKPGKHTVRYRYRPVISVLAYLVCLLGLASWAALTWYARRRPAPSAAAAAAT